MKVKLVPSWNDYSYPPKPWYQVIEEGNKHLCGASGSTWEEAREKALAQAREILKARAHHGDIPPEEETEIVL